jgi:hypothetical protein
MNARTLAARSAAVAYVAVAVMLAPSIGVADTVTLGTKTLTVFRTCILTATPSTTTTVSDAAVQQNSATSNFGTATTMNVQSLTLQNQRALLSFDLTKCNPAIPSTASVKTGTLRIYITVVPATCRTYDIFRLGTTWSESTLTWNNQPSGTSLNNPPTAQRTSSISAGLTLCTYTTPNQYVTFDVKTDVAAFVAGTTNAGWMIRDDAESSATPMTGTFSTKNADVVAQAPQLIVTYAE